MIIPLEKAIEILDKSTAVIIEYELCSFSLDENSEEFLTILLNNYNYTFNKSNNKDVKIFNSIMLLKDDDNNGYEIALLFTQNLEVI